MFHERCFVCKKCEAHLSHLGPTCVALYDQHYCMPCGARFEPLDPAEIAAPAKNVAKASSEAPKASPAAAPAAPEAATPGTAADPPAPKGDLRDQARSRLLNAFSKLSTHVDEMDEEEKKLVAKIEEEEARLKDMERKQRVERFRARQGSINLPPGQRPGSLDAVMAAVKGAQQQPEEIDSETQKSLQKEQKIYASEQARRKAEQQERLQRFKAGLTERKGDVSRSSDSVGEIGRSSDSVGDEDEAERRRKEQEILDLIAEEERRRQQEERDRQVKNVRYFLDDLKESTLAVLEREATGGRVSGNELDVVQRNLERADRLFGGDDDYTSQEAAPEGRFERTLDKLLSLMEDPNALSKLAQLVSPNVAPQGQSHVAFYEKVKQDTEWARRQREAREAELASMRRN